MTKRNTVSTNAANKSFAVFATVINANYNKTIQNKNLSCRRETARRFVSLNILLSHSRSFEVTLLRRSCMSPY